MSFLRYFFALCGRGLECQSDSEPYIVQTVDLVYEQMVLIGGVVVVEGHVEAKQVGSHREYVHADFGRYENTPFFIAGAVNIVIRSRFAILRTYLDPCVWSKLLFGHETVTEGGSERHLEQHVLLVTGELGGGREMECLSVDVLIVGVEGHKQSDTGVGGDVVTAFEVHAPTAGLVRESVVERYVELPVDIGIAFFCGSLCPTC